MTVALAIHVQASMFIKVFGTSFSPLVIVTGLIPNPISASSVGVGEWFRGFDCVWVEVRTARVRV